MGRAGAPRKGTPVERCCATEILRRSVSPTTFMGCRTGSGRAVRMVTAGGRAERANALVFNRRPPPAGLVPAATVWRPPRGRPRLFEMLRLGPLDGAGSSTRRSVAEGQEDRRAPESGAGPDGWAGGAVGARPHLGGRHGPADLARFMGDLSEATRSDAGADC